MDCEFRERVRVLSCVCVFFRCILDVNRCGHVRRDSFEIAPVIQSIGGLLVSNNNPRPTLSHMPHTHPRRTAQPRHDERQRRRHRQAEAEIAHTGDHGPRGVLPIVLRTARRPMAEAPAHHLGGVDPGLSCQSDPHGGLRSYELAPRRRHDRVPRHAGHGQGFRGGVQPLSREAE